jgi:metal-sulfur cluster biosynthetic enzyme
VTGAGPTGVGTDLVRAALSRVIDPCSLVNGTRLSLIDLGMIDDLSVAADGTISIDLLLDDPLCLYMGAIHEEIHDRIAEVAPDAAVQITIRGDVIWTSARATPATRQKIETWQAKRRERSAGRRPSSTGEPVRVGAPRLRPGASER